MNFLIHRCNYILLSQVCCAWQVVKTPTIISNNPVFCVWLCNFVACFILYMVLYKRIGYILLCMILSNFVGWRTSVYNSLYVVGSVIRFVKPCVLLWLTICCFAGCVILCTTFSNFVRYVHLYVKTCSLVGSNILCMTLWNFVVCVFCEWYSVIS